jgi:hypothetical protein
MKKEIMIAALAVGLMTGCATRVAELRDLPFPVQQTIIEQAPNGDIAKVNREIRDEGIVYEVNFHNPAVYPQLEIAADGTLLQGGRPVVMRERAGATQVIVPSVVAPAPVAAPELRVGSETLPVAVYNAIRAKAPNAKIVDVDKEVRSQTVYEVQFADPGLNPKLHITEDGTVLEPID